jgi:5'(3')-deoxyribonucleotidase
MKTIFLDMDGVVADWQTRVREILGHPLPEGQRWADEDWRGLIQFQRLYSELPLMPDARYLVRQCQILALEHGYELRFLTAVPRRNDFPWAFQDKMCWVNRYWPEIPVWFGPYSDDKQTRSAPGQVLIDDRVSNIEQWRARGGWAYLYQGDAKPALDALRQYLDAPSQEP